MEKFSKANILPTYLLLQKNALWYFRVNSGTVLRFSDSGDDGVSILQLYDNIKKLLVGNSNFDFSYIGI